MKLRLFLVLVIIYIVAVFGWWLYSFISYTEKEYELEHKHLVLNALLIQNEIKEFLELNRSGPEEKPVETFLRKEKEIRDLHQRLNTVYHLKTRFNLRDTGGFVHNLIDIHVDEEAFRAIYRNLVKKQRVFYSEVIFFTIVVVSGVIWVFSKLESLLNLNKMQNNFLLSVTHELKTPLTAIKLSSQTLQQRKTDEDTRQALVTQIVSNSDRLNELLDNVLLATRIDGNSYRYAMSRTDLSAIIRKSAEQVLSSPHFQGKFVFDEGPRMIQGDEISLGLVFSNLFQNAVKYAGSHAEVSVGYFNADGRLGVQVADDGKGMDPSEHKAIFNKFYRVGDENTRENKGTGLGLYLVKQILQSHKALIRATSQIPQGTRFMITFKKENYE